MRPNVRKQRMYQGTFIFSALFFITGKIKFDLIFCTFSCFSFRGPLHERLRPVLSHGLSFNSLDSVSSLCLYKKKAELNLNTC